MRKFSISIWSDLDFWYNHYLSDKFIEEEMVNHPYYFKENYPLSYSSRKFDKLAIKWKDGACGWGLDNEWHRVGKPAMIWADGEVSYWENGRKVK